MAVLGEIFIKSHTLIAEVWQKFNSFYTANFVQDSISFFLVFGKIVTKIRSFLSTEHVQLCFL